MPQPKSMGAAMAGMQPGESRVGFLGEPPYIKPDDEPEKLDAKDEARKSLYRNFLKKWIQPNKLSLIRERPLEDKASFEKKMDRSDLVDLKRLIPSQVKRLSNEKLQGLIDAETLESGIQVETQSLYKDVSP